MCESLTGRRSRDEALPAALRCSGCGRSSTSFRCHLRRGGRLFDHDRRVGRQSFTAAIPLRQDCLDSYVSLVATTRPLLASNSKWVLPPRPPLTTNFPARATLTSLGDAAVDGTRLLSGPERMLAEAVERSDTDPPSVAIYLSISRSAAPVAGGPPARTRTPRATRRAPPKGPRRGRSAA